MNISNSDSNDDINSSNNDSNNNIDFNSEISDPELNRLNSILEQTESERFDDSSKLEPKKSPTL